MGIAIVTGASRGIGRACALELGRAGYEVWANYRSSSADAESLKAEIEAAIAPVRAALEALPEDHRWLVTSEGAFSYLARDFGLKELFLWPINADAQGTPQQVRAVIDAVRAHDIPVVFSESTVSDKPARQIARETGIAIGGELFSDTLSQPGGPAATYLDMMRHNARQLLAAFGA